MSRYASLDEIVEQIWDGATIAILGAGGGILEPTALINALAERFHATGSPRNLTVVHSSGLGDGSDLSGLGPLAVEGLVTRFIGGHFGLSGALKRFIAEDKAEAYNLPQGVISQLYREEAAGRPGLVSTIGMGTFIDPEQRGGRLNARSTGSVVERVTIAGREYLFYPTIPIDFAFIRASEADTAGNLSFLDEPYVMDSLEIASAARRERDTEHGRRRGKVIVQVKRAVDALPSRDVHIPGLLVDDIAVVVEQRQSYVDEVNDHYSGKLRTDGSAHAPLPFSERRVIAARASVEASEGQTINMGVGIPDGVASILRERRITVNSTVEHGVIGGVTATGAIFGACSDHDAVIPMPNLIDLYQGGLLDVTFLGFAQIDKHGNVNVSRYGTTVTGTGGFIDISQYARKVVFCGTLTAGGLKVEYTDTGFGVLSEGRNQKFVDEVEEICFSAERALASGQEVLYVTERAVFQLTSRGLQLIEIAPGVDVDRDIRPNVSFEFEVTPGGPRVFAAEVLQRPESTLRAMG